MEFNWKNLSTGFAAVCAATLLTSGIAFAQDNTLDIDAEDVLHNNDIEKAVKTSDTRVAGWYPKLHVGGSAMMNYNKNYDGNDDGIAFTFGLVLNAGIDRIWDFGDAGKLIWENKLDIEEQLSKTPTLDHWTIPKDSLEFQTMLKYGIPNLEWLGPYLRFSLNTHLFNSTKTFSSDMYIRYFNNGADSGNKGSEVDMSGANPNAPINIEFLEAQNVRKIANPGNPLVLTEAVGLFMDPYKSTPVNVSIKVGIAGQHNVVSGDGDSFVAWDTDADDKIDGDHGENKVFDVIKLVDTNSVGLEAGLVLNGTLVEVFNWEVTGSMYFPFAGDYSQDFKDHAGERIKAEVKAKIGVNICSWANFSYSLEAKRDPFNYFPKGFADGAKEKDAWQFTSTLLFNITYDFFDSSKPI